LALINLNYLIVDKDAAADAALAAAAVVIAAIAAAASAAVGSVRAGPRICP
jgi:hypothetical protein